MTRPPTGTAGKRERTKAANREAILVAARRVFADLGYGAASVRDIVRETDLATGTFYNYFPDKESVLRALVDEIAVEARARVRAARTAATTLEGFVSGGFRAYFEFLAEDPDTVALMRRNAGTIRTMFDEPALGAGIDELRADLETAVRAGRIPPHDADSWPRRWSAPGSRSACGWSSASRPTSSARWRSSPTCSWARLNALGRSRRVRNLGMASLLRASEPNESDPPSPCDDSSSPSPRCSRVLAIPAGASAYTLGVSDQQARTFTNPLFAPLKFKAARYITPYDVMESPADKAAARRLGERRARRAPEDPRLLRALPSQQLARPKAPIGRRVHARSSRSSRRPIRTSRRSRPGTRSTAARRATRQRPGPADNLQPTTGPKRVAQYYMAARKVFKGSKYRSSASTSSTSRTSTRRSSTCKSFLRYATPDPKIIGFHNYSDTNRFSTTRTKRVLPTFRGKVWLTETGGIVKLGTLVPVQHEPRGRRRWAACSRWPSRTRASAACSSTSSTRRPIGDRRFDAGLINPDGTQAPGLRRRQEPQGAQLP